MARKQWLSVGDLTLEGYTNADGVTVYADNAPNQYAIFCGKAGAPSNSYVGYYMTGCLYINLTNGALYYNAGTTPGTASWSAIGTMTTSTVTTAMLQANCVTPIKMGTRTVVALSDTAATPNIAQLMTSSIFTITPTQARTFTTPTAALIVAGVSGATVGSWFDFTIVNTAQFAVTVTAGANVTIVGDAVVNKGTGTFRAVLTNVTGSSETVSIYRLDSGSVATDIPLANGSILIGDANGSAAANAVSGDITMTNAGVTAIGAKKVVNTMIAAAAGTILGGTTTSADVTAIDNSVSGSIVIGQGAATTCAAHVLSGDATMSNTGAVTLAYPKVAAIVSQALLFSGFTDNTNATGYIDIATQIPAHSLVLGWKAVVTTGFSGDTTATIEVGIAGGLANFSGLTTNSVLTSSTEVGSASAVASSYCAAATTARVTVTGGADFTSINAGSMVVTLYIVKTA